MKSEKYKVLNALIENHKQFTNKSNLFDEIVRVTGCSLAKAKELAATHCNMVSFWAILCAQGKYLKSYGDFFKWCLDMKYCDLNGYIRVNKLNILDALDLQSTLKKFSDWEDILDPKAQLNEDKFYQIKIFAETDGDHFMAGYIQDGVFYGSDTSFRGTPFNFVEKIKPEKFQWVMEVI